MTLAIKEYASLLCGSAKPPLHFGVVVGGDVNMLYAHRMRVYKKYGYVHEAFVGKELDCDSYDTNGSATHVVALRDGRLVGSLRILSADTLPLDTFFSYTFPTDDALLSRAEISRLVVERSENDKDIPRNAIMLFLMDVALRVAKEKGIALGVAYIKQRLLKKLALLRFPVTSVADCTCRYPHDGFMAPYFYGQPDDLPIPSYVHVDEAEKVLDSYIRSGRLFEQKSDGMFVLRSTLYTEVLKKLGILV